MILKLKSNNTRVLKVKYFLFFSFNLKEMTLERSRKEREKCGREKEGSRQGLGRERREITFC